MILETIHAAGCSAAACHAQMYTMGTLLRHGSAAQKERYLPAIARGELRLQAFGVTEPGSGTDTPALKTRAVRQGDRYVVHGQKIWTSRALHSDLMLLLCRTTPLDDCRKRSDGLSVLLVDLRDAVGNGIEIRPIETMINHQTTEIFIDGLEVPAASLIGQEGQGFRYILDGMNAERILLSGEAVGDGRWFIERAVAYAKERAVFDRPIGQNQGIQFPLAKALARLDAAELMARAGSRPLRCGEPLWSRGEQRQAAHRRGGLGGGRGLLSDVRRLRLRQGIRHRAQMARMPAVPDSTHLDEHGTGLPGADGARAAARVLRV